MAKFYVFYGQDFYPAGGIYDYKNTIETELQTRTIAPIEKIQEFLLGKSFDWAHVVNEDMKKVWEYHNSFQITTGLENG